MAKATSKLTKEQIRKLEEREKLMNKAVEKVLKQYHDSIIGLSDDEKKSVNKDIYDIFKIKDMI
jgi:hypothetical protein